MQKRYFEIFLFNVLTVIRLNLDKYGYDSWLRNSEIVIGIDTLLRERDLRRSELTDGTINEIAREIVSLLAENITKFRKENIGREDRSRLNRHLKQALERARVGIRDRREPKTIESPGREFESAVEKEVFDLFLERGINFPNTVYIRELLEKNRWSKSNVVAFLDREKAKEKRRREKESGSNEPVNLFSREVKKKKKNGKSTSSTTSKHKKADVDDSLRVSALEAEIDQLQKGLAAATENLNQLKKSAGKRVGEDQQKPEDLVDFYFEIFPPGRWDSKDFTQHYKELVRQGKFQEREVQWDRIREIENLKPETRRKGKLLWNGYVVYEFAYTDNVVLE